MQTRWYFAIILLLLLFLCPFYFSVEQTTPVELELSGKTIILDPGHGSWSSDTGTAWPLLGNADYIEKDVVLNIAKKLRTVLQAKGAKVYLTRESDLGLKLLKDDRYKEYDRRRTMKKDTNSIFISIHLNGDPNLGHPGKGVRVIYSPQNNPDGKSVELGWEMIATLDKLFPYSKKSKISPLMTPEQTEHKRLSVLYRDKRTAINPQRPAVLVEIGFLTSSIDRILISSETGRQKITNSLASAVENYFSEQVIKKEGLIAKTVFEKSVGEKIASSKASSPQKELFVKHNLESKKVVKISEKESEVIFSGIKDTLRDAAPLYFFVLPAENPLSINGITVADFKKTFWGVDYQNTHKIPLGSANLDYCGAYSIDASKPLELDYSIIYGRMVRVCFVQKTFAGNEFSIKLNNWDKKDFSLTAAQDTGMSKNVFDEVEIVKTFYKNSLKQEDPVYAQRTKTEPVFISRQSMTWGWDVSEDECKKNYCDSEQFLISQLKNINAVINGSISEEKKQTLVSSYAFLKTDGFSEDFFKDFKVGLGENLFATPLWFKGQNGLGEFVENKIKIIPNAIYEPGLYQVKVYFESDNLLFGEKKLLSDTLKEDLFRNKQSNGTFVIELAKIRAPEIQDHWMYFPIDGSLGTDGHRVGYGTLVVDGEPIVVDKKETGEIIFIPLRTQGAESFQRIHSRTVSSLNLPVYNLQPTGSYTLTLNTAYVGTLKEAIEMQGETILDSNEEGMSATFSPEILPEPIIDEDYQDIEEENLQEITPSEQTTQQNVTGTTATNSPKVKSDQIIPNFRNEFLIILICFVLFVIVIFSVTKKWSKSKPERRK